jgi:hypothetical protein
MFRPSRGHLPADILNILESIQIVCGREISLLTGIFTSLVFIYNLILRLKLEFRITRLK